LPRFRSNAGAGIEVDTMLAFKLAEEYRYPAWRADRAGDMGIGKQNAFIRQFIELWCLHNRIAGAAHHAVGLIICENKNKVWLFIVCGAGSAYQTDMLKEQQEYD